MKKLISRLTASGLALALAVTAVPFDPAGWRNCKAYSVAAADSNSSEEAADAQSYDVSVPHVIINQIYGSGNDGYVSHSFIELYNPTDSDIDMEGWSINYREPDSYTKKGKFKNKNVWSTLDLSGAEIKAHCSYLIRCAAVKDTENVKYTVEKYDLEWDQKLNNKGLSILLLSDKADSVTGKTDDVFDNSLKKPQINGYVDMLSVGGNDNEAGQFPPCYESSYLSEQSKKKAVRRKNYADTDDNAADTEIIDYSGDYYQDCVPRSSADGPVDLATEIEQAKEKIPKYYKEYCTAESVTAIDEALKKVADTSEMTDAAMLTGLQELEKALGTVKYKTNDGELSQIFITTDKGDGTSYGQTLSKGNGYVRSSVVLTDTAGSVQIDDSHAQVKVRGNMTAGGAKKPYNIKFDSKQNVFDFGKSKKWVLIADYYDPTLMHNALALDLGQKIGLDATMDHRRVEVWVDGQYNGLYLLTEKIEADKNRVDIEPDKGDFLAEMDVKDRTEAGNNYFTTDSGQYYRLREPDEDDCNEEKLQAAKDHMNELEALVRCGDYHKVKESIDEETFVKYYLVNEFVKTLDFWWKSVYFYYRDDEKKFYAGPLWDFDLAVHSAYWTQGPEGEYAATCHFYNDLMQYPEFRLAVKKEWDKDKDIFEYFADGSWYDEQLAKYRGAISRDTSLWHNDVNYDSVLAEDRTWLAERFKWMNGYLDEKSTGAFSIDGSLYYYKSGEPVKGLIQIGNDYYYFGADNKAVTGSCVVTDNDAVRPDGKGTFPAGTYTFDDTGRMQVPVAYEKQTVVTGTAATCTEAGIRSYILVERTGKVYDPYDMSEASPDDFIIPAGHDFSVKIVAPTVSEAGYTLHVCERCGYSYKDEITDPLVPETSVPEKSEEQKEQEKTAEPLASDSAGNTLTPDSSDPNSAGCSPLPDTSASGISASDSAQVSLYGSSNAGTEPADGNGANGTSDTAGDVKITKKSFRGYTAVVSTAKKVAYSRNKKVLSDSLNFSCHLSDPDGRLCKGIKVKKVSCAKPEKKHMTVHIRFKGRKKREKKIAKALNRKFGNLRVRVVKADLSKVPVRVTLDKNMKIKKIVANGTKLKKNEYKAVISDRSVTIKGKKHFKGKWTQETES